MADPRRLIDELLDDPAGGSLGRALIASARNDAPTAGSRARVARRLGIAAVLAAGASAGSEAGAIAATWKLAGVVVALGGVVGLAIWQSPPAPEPARPVASITAPSHASPSSRLAPAAGIAQERSDPVVPATAPDAIAPATEGAACIAAAGPGGAAAPPVPAALSAPPSSAPPRAPSAAAPRAIAPRAPAHAVAAPRVAAPPAGAVSIAPDRAAVEQAPPPEAAEVETPLASSAPAAPPTPSPPSADSTGPAGPATASAPMPQASAPSRLAAEVALVDGARARLAAGEAAAALVIIAQYHRDFPRGDLDAEADVVTIEAVIAQKDVARARALGAAFLSRFPRSPHAQRVRSLLDGLSP